MRALLCSAIIGLLVPGCSAQPPADLASSLDGVSKSVFLRCSGPPQLSETQGNQERMTFLANRAGEAGAFSAAAAAPFACSGNALFQDGRLTSVTFGGNQAVCMDVFRPCQHKTAP